MVLIAAMCVGAGIALHAGQDATFDLFNYHFYDPYAFVHARFNWDVQPADIHTYLNPLLDVPTYVLIMHTSPRFTAATFGAVQGLNLWLVFEIALVLLRDRIQSVAARYLLALTAGAAALFGGVLFSELGLSLGDATSSVPVLLGLLLVLKSTQLGRAAFWVRNVGFLCVGVAVGLKLTNSAMGIGLIVATLAIGGSLKDRLRTVAWAAAATAVGVLLTAGFWFVLLWRHRGSPTYPYYNAIFHSSYFPDDNLVVSRTLPHGLSDYLLMPFRTAQFGTTVTSNAPMRDPQFAVVFVALLVAGAAILLRRRRGATPGDRSPATAVLIVFFVASYAVWAHQFAYVRYAVVLESLSGVVVLIALLTVVRDLRLVAPGLLAVVVAMSAFTIAPRWGHIPFRSEMFGPNLAKQFAHVRGTVLLAGHDPVAFLVPYLPRDVRVIKFSGMVEFPQYTTAKYNALIMGAIRDEEQSGRPFYSIETRHGSLYEQGMLMRIGYRNAKCTRVRTWYGPQYRICRLAKI